MRRGDDGYKIGDKVELSDGVVLQIDGIQSGIDIKTGKSHAIFESDYPRRQFRAGDIARLVRPAMSTVQVRCSRCEVEYRVFKEDERRYGGLCPDCVHEEEERELAIFDQHGKRIA